jgi:sensor histidine kinase regulating citrate/malate metabolism
MSRIYDALIKAGEKRRRSRIGLPRTQKKDEARLLSLSWQNLRVEWKFMGTVASVMLFFGLISMTIVNQVRQALRTQIDKRALIIATNLSDAAAGHVMGRNFLELHALVTKYARLEGSAYAFIEDGNGQIVAQSLRLFPAELRETLPMDDRRQVNRRVVSLQGKTVYETRTPILEGQVGVARVGMWEEAVKTEIYSALLPTIALLVIMFLAGVIFAVILTRGIIWPIGWPTDMTGETSVGDPEAVVDHRLTG